MTTYADELAHYESNVDELRRGQLKTVQTSATRWSALMAGLLAVFGTVAFAGGLNTVERLPSPADAVVKALTTLAAVSAVVAIWYLSRAAGGLDLTDLPHINGKILMERETASVGAARRRIRIGKVCAVVTVALVLAGSAVVLWVPAAASQPKFLVRFPDAAYCGTLVRNGDRIAIGGRDLAAATEVIPVAACPATPR
ncbi:MAG TPA: hypothetical protein VGJ07_00035 [Rugosimonospora sp.]|jgi:predicted secreted protein